MTTADLVVAGSRVVTPDGARPAAVVISGGVIADVVAPSAAPDARRRIDAGDQVVLPGLVDTHVHLNEPGRAEWEGFESGTRAAAAGGVTTVVDMPLNSVPATTTVAALQAKARAAAGRATTDYALWGGVVPGNERELAGLVQAGAPGCKCFLVPSGVDEFAPVTAADLGPAMRRLADLGAVLLVHAELPGPIERARPGRDGRRYESYLASRPAVAEHEAIALVLELCRTTGCAVHIVHLSSAGALPTLADARASGLPVTVETCPHYLTFAAEQIADGATAFKCAPPIRDAENRERLWQGLARGIIDFVASDHSPAPVALKRLESGDFLAAWGGIASLELLLAATWTAARARGHGPEQLARWLAERPARLAGLTGHKGRIAPGCDADLVIWDPEPALTVDPTRLHHRHPITPYAGTRLCGAVSQTLLRGTCVYERGQFPGGPQGQWIRRERSV